MPRKWSDIRQIFLSQVRKQLVQYDPSHDSTTANALAKSWVNKYIQDVSGAHDYNFLKRQCTIVTTASVPQYTLPDNYRDTLAITEPTANKQLFFVDQGAFIDAMAASTNSGNPDNYYFSGDNKITFDPTPDSIYNLKLDYFAHIEEIVNDNDFMGLGGTDSTDALSTHTAKYFEEAVIAGMWVEAMKYTNKPSQAREADYLKTLQRLWLSTKQKVNVRRIMSRHSRRHHKHGHLPRSQGYRDRH